MSVDELKQKVESYRTSLKDKDGKLCTFSESGPASMGLIDALVAVVAEQDSRIKELESR